MNYTAIRDTLVLPKIRAFGKTAILRRPGTAVGWTKSWDAGSGRYMWTLNIAPFTVVYVDPALAPTDLSGYVLEKQYQQREIDGTTVMANDRRFLTIELTDPTTADKLVIGGSILTIVNVASIQPGDTPLVRVLQCRGV